MNFEELEHEADKEFAEQVGDDAWFHAQNAAFKQAARDAFVILRMERRLNEIKDGNQNGKSADN